MRKTLSLLLLILLSVARPAAVIRAQTSESLAAAASALPAQVTVTFTFQSPTADYSLYAGEGNEQRYYISVPTSNIPSYKVTPAGAPIQVMVDNEKSSNESIVFWIPARPGTMPRINRSQSSLSLTFAPAKVPAEERASVAAAAVEATSPTTLAPGNTAALAQPTPQPQGSTDPRDKPLPTANVDLSVPESPAFTILDLTPETVVRPSSPREFASALLSGVDRNGNFQSGTALDFAPYLTLAGNQLTLRQYQDNYRLRLASRTQFSFATTKGASDDDKSVRLALGFRITLWDQGDPHTDQVLMDCFKGVQKTFFANTTPPTILPPELLPATATDDQKMKSGQAWREFEAKSATANETRNQGNEQCRADSRKRNWNKSSWIVAFAPSWISKTGQTNNFRWNGGGFWTSVAYGFDGFPGLQKHSQLIFHARYRNKEQVPDPDNEGAFFSQNSLFLGTRLRVGTENSTASFEGVFVRSHPEGKAFDNSARYSVGLERRIAENLWFALAFGGESGRQDNKNKGFVMTSFKWGFSQKSSSDSAPSQ
jgi:hypothetical protein